MGPRSKENWHRIMLMEQTQMVPRTPHETMLGKCRIGPGSDNSDNVDVGPMQLEVDINDALVGATGVQFTEQVGIEIEPGIPYYKWYSRRGQYNMCQDTDCACMRTSDGDGQPWCGDNPIYRLSHAVVLIALVRHLGMVRKGNTVAERVSEMVHAPVPGTSRLLAPPQREIWRHGGLLSSIGYATPVPMCTRYNGMTTPWWR